MLDVVEMLRHQKSKSDLKWMEINPYISLTLSNLAVQNVNGLTAATYNDDDWRTSPEERLGALITLYPYASLIYRTLHELISSGSEQGVGRGYGHIGEMVMPTDEVQETRRSANRNPIQRTVH
ncbi:hypothetical protein J6590_058056 [Homalodisca vitripennis]|nr:hypothetical protein J6590_058056 [Homalodisca vitripennis]